MTTGFYKPQSRSRKSSKRRYSIVHPLFMSFFSKDFYQDAGRNWKGFSFVYLMLLLFLCWIPTMIALQRQISDFMMTSAREFIVQVPEITIFHGEISIDEKEPYFIEDPESDEIFAIIDTTGQYTSLNDTTANILVTKKKVILRKSRRETRTFDLSDIESFTLNQDLMNRWAVFFEKWFTIISFPIALLFSFVYRTIQVLIYAAIGLLFAKAKKTNLSFQALISIAIMAITPVLIIDTIMSLKKIAVPFWGIWCFVIAMAYLFYGVKANCQEEFPEEPQRFRAQGLEKIKEPGSEA